VKGLFLSKSKFITEIEGNLAQVVKLPRQSDGEGFFLYFTGGFRAAKIAEDAWQIEPVIVDGFPCATGPLTKSQLAVLAKENDYREIAFHTFGWKNGVYYSSWSPIVPGKRNHLEGPSELWSNIAGNIARARTKDFFETADRLSQAEITQALDDQNPVEALAGYISLSLRSMDISVEKIADHYHEQLVNHMAAGRLDGERYANTLSQTLYAHVHSFFLHLGAARDYLGALIAFRIGLDPQKADSMARLVGELRRTHLPTDPLLDVLFSSGNIAAHRRKAGKFAVSGWLQEATSIRNTLVHRRPYGSKFGERSGWATPTQKRAGLFRYFRPLDLNGNAEQDVFDVLHHHYRQCTYLMHQAAIASGYDTSMLHITNKDVISLDVGVPGRSDK